MNDATLEEKIEYINSNLKPLYKERYEQGLLLEALDTLIGTFSDDESDKQSKEFHTKRKTEVEKELARKNQLIKFFEAKLKPLEVEQNQREAEQPTEPASNGRKHKETVDVT